MLTIKKRTIFALLVILFTQGLCLSYDEIALACEVKMIRAYAHNLVDYDCSMRLEKTAQWLLDKISNSSTTDYFIKRVTGIILDSSSAGYELSRMRENEEAKNRHKAFLRNEESKIRAGAFLVALSFVLLFGSSSTPDQVAFINSSSQVAQENPLNVPALPSVFQYLKGSDAHWWIIG